MSDHTPNSDSSDQQPSPDPSGALHADDALVNPSEDHLAGDEPSGEMAGEHVPPADGEDGRLGDTALSGDHMVEGSLEEFASLPETYDIIAEAQEVAERALASSPLPAINLANETSLLPEDQQSAQMSVAHAGSFLDASE